MRYVITLLLALLSPSLSSALAGELVTLAGNSTIQPAAADWPNVFVHQDTCNVYVLRDGDSALLFNLGDGTILDHLKTIGVKNIDWILFTDHHREQCQGIARIDRATTKIAAPKEEQALFETPLQFRKWRPTLGDAHTVHGASYVRPPAATIKLDRALAADEVFTWRGHEIKCISSPGHSPGGMCYVLRKGDQACAFTGGIMHDGARMTNWYDSEWDYGFGKGLDALIESVQRLGTLKLSWAFPSQGPSIQHANEQLEKYHRRLVAFRPDYLRGYPVKNLTQRLKVDPNVKPTPIRQIVQVTPHLYKFSDELAGKNFAILIADSGRALLLDCGIFPELLLHDLIKDMQTHLGLKGIDALWINHMHGDHFTLGAVLKKRYGVKVWTLDRIADKVENPLYYDYCALITSYNPEYEGLKVDRPLRDGEIVEWEGLKLHVDWMPGQTEFGNCLWLELDGKRIAFTGDNLFGDPSDPEQNGHEAVVARNSAIFEEGYLLGSRYLRDLKPNIVMGAHNVLMANPAAFLDRYHEWSKRIISRYRELLPDSNYEYQFDPFWVSAYPYRLDLQQQRSQDVTITVRNFRDRPQKHRVQLRLPPGLTARPEILEGTVEAKSRSSFKVTITADPARVSAGVQMIPMDITLDGKRYGELFDFLAQASAAETGTVKEAADGASQTKATMKVAACQAKRRSIDWRLKKPADVLVAVDKNLLELETIVNKAGEAGCDALALPEDTLGLLDWSGANEEAAKQVLPEGVKWMIDRLGRAAAKHQMYLVVCSDLPEPDGKTYNTAFFLGKDGKEVGRYRKTCPTWSESGSRERGKEYPIFPTSDLGTVGMLICYDLVFPETARCLALQGADVIFFPTMGGAAVGDDDIGLQALRVRAAENHVYLVVAFRGQGAMIISPRGKIIAQAEGPDGLAIADIDPRGGREGGDSSNTQKDMRARLFRERNPDAFRMLTDPNPPVLSKVPIDITREEAGRIFARMLTVGEEDFNRASALAGTGKIKDAIAAFEKLRTDYRGTWIDRVAKERLESLQAQDQKK